MLLFMQFITLAYKGVEVVVRFHGKGHPVASRRCPGASRDHIIATSRSGIVMERRLKGFNQGWAERSKRKLFLGINHKVLSNLDPNFLSLTMWSFQTWHEHQKMVGPYGPGLGGTIKDGTYDLSTNNN
jgi:hypothetical protein